MNDGRRKAVVVVLAGLSAMLALAHGSGGLGEGRPYFLCGLLASFVLGAAIWGGFHSKIPRVRLIARAVCLVLLLAGAAFWFGLPRLRPMPTFGFIAGQALLAAMWLSMHTHGRERGSVLR